MIQVTELARKELKEILVAHVDNWYARLRLIPKEPKVLDCSIDIEMPGDEVITHEGSGLLVVDNELSASLDGTILDVKNDGDGNQIVMYKRN